jgi:hypothetical protein
MQQLKGRRDGWAGPPLPPSVHAPPLTPFSRVPFSMVYHAHSSPAWSSDHAAMMSECRHWHRHCGRGRQRWIAVCGQRVMFAALALLTRVGQHSGHAPIGPWAVNAQAATATDARITVESGTTHRTFSLTGRYAVNSPIVRVDKIQALGKRPQPCTHGAAHPHLPTCPHTHTCSRARAHRHTSASTTCSHRAAHPPTTHTRVHPPTCAPTHPFAHTWQFRTVRKNARRSLFVFAAIVGLSGVPVV